MKLFAIQSQNGYILDGASKSEDQAWENAFLGQVDREELSRAGYRCIELHTYDPSKQVVEARK